MQTVLLAAARAVALDPPYDAVFAPLVDELVDTLARDDDAPFLVAVEGRARLLANERALRLADVLSALRLGLTVFRSALGDGPGEASVAARVERLEGEVMVRAGIGFAEGLEETIAELDRAVVALSTIDELTGVAKPNEIARQFAVELDRCRRMDLALGAFVVGLDPPAASRAERAQADELLRRLARLLRDGLRQYDAVGRCGDAELLAVLPDATRRGTQSVVDRLRHDLVAESAPGRSDAVRFAVAHLDFIDMGAPELAEQLSSGLRRARAARDDCVWV